MLYSSVTEYYSKYHVHETGQTVSNICARIYTRTFVDRFCMPQIRSRTLNALNLYMCLEQCNIYRDLPGAIGLTIGRH